MLGLKTLAVKISSALRAPNSAFVQQPSRPPSPRSEPPNALATARASDIAGAVRAAEHGDPRQLFTLYRDFVLSDEHVQGCLNTRKLAVLGQPLSIMPRNRLNPDDVAAAAACNRAVADCENWRFGLAALMDSHAFWPVSICEKIFAPAGVTFHGGASYTSPQNTNSPTDNIPQLQYTFRRFEPVEYPLLCWKWAYQAGAKVDVNRWEYRLKLWPLDADARIVYDLTQAEYLDPVRHIAHRGHLLNFKDNWGGPGRSILGWIFLRAVGRDWFGRFMERYGNPFTVGKTDSKDPQAVQFLQDAFNTASKICGLVIDREDQVELTAAAVQGGAEGHKLWHDVCNNAISRALTGNDASSNPGGLNAGQSKKSENVREDVRMFDQLTLADTLERQLFAQFLAINGLTGRIKVSFGGLSDEDAGTFAATLKTLSESGFEPTDDALPTINERLGIPVQRKLVGQASSPASSLGVPAQRPNGGASADATGAAIASLVNQSGPAGGASVPTSLVNQPGSPSQRPNGDATGAAITPPQTFTISVQRDLRGQIISYSIGTDAPRSALPIPRLADPTDTLATEHAPELAAAMRESFGPLLEIITHSTSAAEAEKNIAAYLADWRPNKMIEALEKPLQLAAAHGTAAAAS